MTTKHPAGAHVHLQRVLGRYDIVLMIIVAIVNLNTLSPIAGNGAIALWLWPLAFVFFFIPQGIAVVELSHHYPGEGGVYLWPNRLLGRIHGFLSGWCYWMSNVVYVPTLIVSGVGLAMYMFGGRGIALAANGTLIEVVSFGVLLLLVGLNIRGLSVEKWLVDGAALGTLLAGGLLVGLAGWLAVKNGGTGSSLIWHPEQLDWHLLPAFSLTCFSLLGLEIASNVGGEIREPRKVLPSAVLTGAVLAGGMYVVLTLAMLVALPQQEIALVQGVLQAITKMAGQAGFTFMLPVVAAILALSIIGAASAWLAGPARIPYVAALDGYLPRAIGRLHERYASPHVALLVSGSLCALALWMSFAGATLNEAYLTILDLSVILGLVQYVYMYASLLSLLFHRRHMQTLFSRTALLVAGLGGMATTLLGTAFAFVPTRQVEHAWLFELKLVGSCLFLMGVGAAFFFVNAKRASAQTA
jgi:amino acid transporter